MSVPDTVPLEDLASLPSFHHPIVSPDGSEVALYCDETGRNELYLLDRESRELTRVTDGEVPRDATWHPRWGPDGDRVYFHRDDAGDEQNDVLAVDRDGAADVVLAPDGQGIFLDATRDTVLYASDEGEQMNLYRHDLASDDTRQLTSYDQPTMGGKFSPDGGHIAFTANESDRLENRDVYVMAADGSEKRRLAIGEDGSETTLGGWFPDGERLLVGDDADDLNRVGIYDLNDGSTRWLGPHQHVESPVAVAPDGERILAARTRRAATMPVIYDVESGAGRELDLPEGVTGFYQFLNFPAGRVFADAATIVVSHTTADERRRLYEYDLDTDEATVLLDAQYDDVDPETFVDAEYVRYGSDDGFEIGALLYDPRDGNAQPADARDVPAVVMVHGGPHYQSTRAFNLHVQFLVSRGYAVLQPNYRGSTGRGRSFKHAIHGDWGGKEQADIANGGRWLMDHEWIDEDRVAVFGGSFGGYSVYCQLTTYPDLWTTGIAWVGITDLHALYEADMPHFKHHFRMQMGDPDENHDLWRERSPIEHVDAMERPILILHGVNDQRCPIEQARLFRDALEERGWEEGEDFEYAELGEEGHGSTDIDQKIRVFGLLDDYLGREL